MGKIKNKRRLHNKAAKAVKAAEESENGKEVPTKSYASYGAALSSAMPMETDRKSKAPSLSGRSAGLFKGVRIDPEALKAQLATFDGDDAKSTITSKSFKGLGVKKKDKMKIKHEIWMQKIDSLHQAKKEVKERKRRQKTVIVGDMKPLEDTLPTLELLMKQSFESKAKMREENAKPNQTKKTRARQQEVNTNISLFKQVVKHPAYQANPFATINEHLKNKLKQEEMDS